MCVIVSLVFLFVHTIQARASEIVSTKASVYSNKFAGKKTASGKRYEPNQLTAASKTLPVGTKALVKNKQTGKQTVVTVTDRGPFVKGRGLDLSKKAANKVGMKGGVAPVVVQPLGKADSHTGSHKG